ncbi:MULTISPECIES: hypothetical protein [Rhodococcus]|uniref:Uncharacterized protein n=1 Tax=Rhodococcus opacus RKJ300 = JCM 13270 TaxID=1165867 RepID=I0WDK9_RHOOP|nr:MULTISPECIES: hypothetical protein [Rhodococcus]EID74475.1 hypothetical protein W59_29869 [Rhodococcus opacus RKJ300 = JCM 13270]QQZ18444.1 hypothetical protein GO592_40400 [Rhodococcus sp. 21391]
MTSIDERLAELRAELDAGEQALAELDQRREQLITSMLRISGAVQILEELTGQPADVERDLVGAVQQD